MTLACLDPRLVDPAPAHPRSDTSDQCTRAQPVDICEPNRARIAVRIIHHLRSDSARPNTQPRAGVTRPGSITASQALLTGQVARGTSVSPPLGAAITRAFSVPAQPLFSSISAGREKTKPYLTSEGTWAAGPLLCAPMSRARDVEGMFWKNQPARSSMPGYRS